MVPIIVLRSQITYTKYCTYRRIHAHALTAYETLASLEILTTANVRQLLSFIGKRVFITHADCSVYCSVLIVILVLCILLLDVCACSHFLRSFLQMLHMHWTVWKAVQFNPPTSCVHVRVVSEHVKSKFIAFNVYSILSVCIICIAHRILYTLCSYGICRELLAQFTVAGGSYIHSRRCMMYSSLVEIFDGVADYA